MSAATETRTRTDAEQAAWNEFVATNLGGGITYETVADEWPGRTADEVIHEFFEDNEVDEPTMYEIHQARLYSAANGVILVRSDSDVTVLWNFSDDIKASGAPKAPWSHSNSSVYALHPQTYPEILAAIDTTAVIAREA